MSEGVIIPLEKDSAKEPEARCRVCGEKLNPNGNCIGILLKIPACLEAHGIATTKECPLCHVPLGKDGQCTVFTDAAPAFWQQRIHGLLTDAG